MGAWPFGPPGGLERNRRSGVSAESLNGSNVITTETSIDLMIQYTSDDHCLSSCTYLILYIIDLYRNKRLGTSRVTTRKHIDIEKQLL